MITIRSQSYFAIKMSDKSKKNKKDRKYPEYDPNPWAVCTESVGRDNKDKYERCVKDVKEDAKIVDDSN